MESLIYVIVFLLGATLGIHFYKKWKAYKKKQLFLQIKRRREMERIQKRRALIERALRRRSVRQKQRDDNTRDRLS